MKLFSTLDVELRYQNFGSTWVGILRGRTEQIEQAFLSLWNLRATSGELEFYNHSQTVGVFWTDEKSMRRYFFNREYLKCRAQERGFIRWCLAQAHVKLDELRGAAHESFMDFSEHFETDDFSVGKVTAEKPDADMKDQILAHAFSDKKS
jgi:hypothetical protein